MTLLSKINYCIVFILYILYKSNNKPGKERVRLKENLHLYSSHTEYVGVTDKPINSQRSESVKEQERKKNRDFKIRGN